MKKEKNKKKDPLFFSIKETCQILHIKPHILDYWIKRFPELKPHKIGKRNFYKKEQIELASQIKKLLDEGYSLEGIRRRLFPSKRETKREIKKEASVEKTEMFTPLFPELKIPYSKEIRTHSGEDKEENLKRLLREVLKELKALYHFLDRA